MKSKLKYAIAADTETGGLAPRDGVAFNEIALTEIAFVCIDMVSLEIVDKNSWLIKPYKEGLIYSKIAQEVSGITPQLLEEKGEDIKEAHKETRDFIKKYTKGKMGKPIMVGHNMYNFDRPFFENMYEFLGDNFSSYLYGYEDTQILSHIKYLENTNYKLGTICKGLGVELTDAHRGLPDTIANAQMFIEMVKLLRSGKVESGGVNKNRFREKFKLDKVSFNY